MKHFQSLVWTLGLILLAGCDAQTPPFSMLPGTYQGTLITQQDGKSQQSFVHVDIDGTELPSETEISVLDTKGTPQLTVKILNLSDTGVELQTSMGMTTPLVLKPDEGCFTAKADVSVSLCPGKNSLTFDVRDDAKNVQMIALSLHQLDIKNTDEPVEKPQAYTLTQAIERARTMSFQSRIEYEHVIQAKNQAKAAYLLLPQITLATVLNNITVVPTAFTATFTTALQDIGDLAPFLLPNRWFEAAAAKDQSKAEQDTYKLLRLDMGVQIEGLFYAYSRDKASAAFTQDILKQAIEIRNQVKILEHLGALAAGSSANMDSIVNQIEQNSISFNQVLAEDLHAISAALGFYSPTAVTDAVIDEEIVPIEKAVSYNVENVNSLALNQSIEIDQMNDLIAAAQQQKRASYFSFLDPYGDPKLGLGAALPAQIAVQKSQIRELGLDRDLVKQTISESASKGVGEYNTAVQLYAKAAEAMQIQQKLLDTEQTYFKLGVKVDFFGLVQIFQDYLTAEINLESARANYRVARSEIDRLLLQGYYARF